MIKFYTFVECANLATLIHDIRQVLNISILCSRQPVSPGNTCSIKHKLNLKFYQTNVNCLENLELPGRTVFYCFNSLRVTFLMV